MNLVGNIKKHLFKSMAVLSICLIFMLLGNYAVNMHMHVLENGAVVTHAHPYDKAADNELPKKHRHSTGEILFFFALSVVFVGLMLIIGWKLQEAETYTFLYRSQVFHSIKYPPQSGRAPPLFSFL